MSNTWTMFACCSDSDSRASSRNIATNFLFLVRFGRMRLMAMFFLNPCSDSATPRNTSAMPPAATRSVMRYRLSGIIAGSSTNYNRWPAAAISPVAKRRVGGPVEPGGGSLLEAAGGPPGLFASPSPPSSPISASPPRPACSAACLLALALLLAVDAQRRHRARQQTPERDRLAALLADVDLVAP